MIPYAPWHQPRERYVGNGVYITNVYASHVIAALIHWPFAWAAARSAAQPNEKEKL